MTRSTSLPAMLVEPNLRSYRSIDLSRFFQFPRCSFYNRLSLAVPSSFLMLTHPCPSSPSECQVNWPSPQWAPRPHSHPFPNLPSRTPGVWCVEKIEIGKNVDRICSVRMQVKHTDRCVFRVYAYVTQERGKQKHEIGSKIANARRCIRGRSRGRQPAAPRPRACFDVCWLLGGSDSVE